MPAQECLGKINLVLHPDNSEVQSYLDTCNVRRNVIRYSRKTISSALLDWWKRNSW